MLANWKNEYANSSSAEGVIISKNGLYVFVSLRNIGLIILDINDKVNPKKIGQLDKLKGGEGLDVNKDETIIY